MKRIRAGSGLGDSLYLRPVCDYYLSMGESVIALTDYPAIFFGTDAAVEPFRRHQFDVVAHYVARKNDPNTTQWQDVCASAGIPEVPFSIKWDIRNTPLTSSVRQQSSGRKIVLVHAGREPMARKDAFAREMLPRESAFRAVAESLADCFLVGIGGKDDVHYKPPVDLDLSGKTTVSDLLDLAKICHGAIGQCSFLVPLVELFDKPLLVLWAAAGLESRERYIRTITPKKILCEPTSAHVVDDRPASEIAEATRAAMRLEAFA